MAAKFWIGGTGTWDNTNDANWSTTSGGANDTTHPTSGDTVTLDANSCPGGETITVAADINVTSVTMGAFTGTLDFSANNNSPTMQTFSGTGTGTRTLNMGSGTWTLTGNNTTIFSLATNTNLTLDAGTSTVNCTYSGSVGIRVINGVIGASFGLYNLKVSAGTDTFDFANTTSLILNNIDFTGFSGTWAADGLECRGSMTLGSGMTCNSTSNAITFKATTSGKTITTNSVQINRPITFDGVGGEWTLQDNLNIDGAASRTLTLTNGTFNANGFNVTCGIFSSSNSNTRTLTMGSGTWTITGSGTTIWTTQTTTNLTNNPGTATVLCNYSGGTGTRTIIAGAALPNLSFSAGTDILALGSSLTCANLNFTGFTGTWSTSTTLTCTGNLTLGTGMTVTTQTGVVSMTSTSGTKTITSNGVQLKRPLTLNGVGGTFQLADAFSTDQTLTLTNGTFDANNFNVTCNIFSSSNSNTRTLTMGSGTWTLTGTGTVWNTATTTNFTLTPGASTIKITDTSANDNTFAGGGLTYNNLWWSRGASANSNIHTGSNRFRDLRDNGSAAHSLLFTAGTTTTVSSFTVSGSSGNLITVDSVTAATHNLVKVDSSNVVCDYLSVDHSAASPGSTWYAGANSTNGGNNSGWIFTGAPVSVLLFGFLARVGHLSRFRLSPVLKPFPVLSRENRYGKKTVNTSRRS